MPSIIPKSVSTEPRLIRSCLRVGGKVGPPKEIDGDKVWYSSALAHQNNIFSLSFSSRRVRVSGSVDGYPVTNITVDSATDVSVVSPQWMKSHPSLRSFPLKPIPQVAVSLRAANGLSLDVLVFSLVLGDVTCTVTALVVSSLGPDSLLPDNQGMSEFRSSLKLGPPNVVVFIYWLKNTSSASCQ